MKEVEEIVLINRAILHYLFISTVEARQFMVCINTHFPLLAKNWVYIHHSEGRGYESITYMLLFPSLSLLYIHLKLPRGRFSENDINSCWP